MKTETIRHTVHTNPSNDMCKKITVNIKGREYDILVGHDWLQSFGGRIRKVCSQKEVMVFTSPRIGKLYFARLKQSLQTAGYKTIRRHDIPDGERNKNMDEYRRAVEALCENFPDPAKIPLVINLGGGVVGDLGGFVASTFRRGVPYVQLPTTLLSCVDCGIGGKTGVNHLKVKNLIGTIYQPKLVLADLALLKTLDPREVRSGVAEVIKCAAVSSTSLFKILERRMNDLLSLDGTLLVDIVGRCLGLKVVVVEADEFDNRGKRIILNFGHTVGHAIEMVADYKLTHGEAISVGMIAATRISVDLRVCSASVYERLHRLITSAGLPVCVKDLGLDVDQVMETMKHDKKFIDGKNRFVLPTEIGQWIEVSDIDQNIVRKSVEFVLT